MSYREHGLSIAKKERTLGAAILDTVMPGRRSFERVDKLSAPERLIDDIVNLVKHGTIEQIAGLLRKPSLKAIHTELARAFRDKVEIIARDAMLAEAGKHEGYLSQSTLDKATGEAVKEPLKLAAAIVDENSSPQVRDILGGVIQKYNRFITILTAIALTAFDVLDVELVLSFVF